MIEIQPAKGFRLGLGIALFTAACLSVKSRASQSTNSQADPVTTSAQKKTAAPALAKDQAVRWLEQPLSPRQVQPRGLLAARMEFNLTKLIRDRQDHTRYIGWGADQIGRWIGATIMEATMLGADADLPIIREKVDELIANQDKEGFYYGKELAATPDRLRECWFGQGRGIWNLVEYYQVTGDAAALASAVKAADLAVAKRAEWKISQPLCGGIESSVSPMARLGGLTRQSSFLDYARYMADGIQHRVAKPSDEPTAHVESSNLHTHEERPFRHHTHSYLNTIHGVLDLAVITGEKKYLDQASGIFEESFSSVWINGGFPESYGDYYERIDETCSTVDWVMLALKLYAATGEARYLDSAELSILNGLMFSQDRSGAFTTYRSVNRHHWADENNRGGEQSACCAMSGGWGLAKIATYAVTTNAQGLSVNLPLELSARLPREGGEVRLAQSVATRPYEMMQTIQIGNDSTKTLEMKVRVPYWCPDPGLRVDGLPRAAASENGFLHLACPAKSDCAIELRLPMKFTVIPARRNALNMARPQGAAGDAKEVGLQYGPWVLMFNREMYPAVTAKDLSVSVKMDGLGRLLVSQDFPKNWTATGRAIPLLIAAVLGDGTPVLLTPCGNMPMTPLKLKDPYVLRFTK